MLKGDCELQFPKLFFYSPEVFESWDYRNPDEQGIGGSETCQIELAKRFAKRGYEVVSYGPIREDTISPHAGVEWKHYSQANFEEDGIWIFSRCPHVIDSFTPTPNRKAWLICQNWDIEWSEEERRKFDKIIYLCPDQGEHYSYFYPNDSYVLGSNGIKSDRMREVDDENIERNPFKIFYFSSPDRGLLNLLHIFKRIREYIPQFELHIAYGFDNLDKVVNEYVSSPSIIEAGKIKDILHKIDPSSDNIFFKGRLGQGEILRELASSQFWVYPTNFKETSCIAGMEAMAMGVIPIVSKIGALKNNIKYGEIISGNVDNPLVQLEFIRALRSWVEYGPLIEKIRPKMMEWARNIFFWERICDLYESWIHGIDTKKHSSICQSTYQLIHAEGNILNVGCNIDSANLHAMGATNVDILDFDATLQRKNKVDIIADSRNLPPILHNKYDTVILGEILEHFLEEEDVLRSIKEAKKCLKPNGKIVITVPEDYRGVREQRYEEAWYKDNDIIHYTDGSIAYHHKPITKDILFSWIDKSNLKLVDYRAMDYGFCLGHGIVAC